MDFTTLLPAAAAALLACFAAASAAACVCGHSFLLRGCQQWRRFASSMVVVFPANTLGPNFITHVFMHMMVWRNFSAGLVRRAWRFRCGSVPPAKSEKTSKR